MEDSAFHDGDYLGYRVSTRLVREPSGLFVPKRIRSAGDVHGFLRHLEDYDREVFYSLHLDSRHQVIGCEEVSKGSLSQSLVHPREIYKSAILNSAGSIIIAHNHPSGDPSPSSEDLAVNGRVYRAGDILGVPLLDSVIIGVGKYWSARESDDRSFG